MELITDNFSNCLHHAETITQFRRDLAFTIALGLGRAVKISMATISTCVVCACAITRPHLNKMVCNLRRDAGCIGSLVGALRPAPRTKNLDRGRRVYLVVLKDSVI